jgi:fatty acid desaturase
MLHRMRSCSPEAGQDDLEGARGSSTMSYAQSDRDAYLGVEISKAAIQRLSAKNPWLAAAKVAAYLLLVAGGATLYCVAENQLLRALAVVALGIVYAHGVELQHEALHGNLFGRRGLDRVAGIVTGAPMLVSFTQYRAYHLHHHRCVGTSIDEELFDYTPRSLSNPVSTIVRVWNLVKLPAFLVTFLKMLQGEYPDKVRRGDQAALLAEYAFLLAMLAVAIVSALWLGRPLLLMLWIVPWLLVAEPVHFMVEVPEHIGCNRSTRSILGNTRSYPAHLLWAYFANFNNFHIEHHLFPTVPAHRLHLLHERIRGADGHCTAGYWHALREVCATVRRERAG